MGVWLFRIFQCEYVLEFAIIRYFYFPENAKTLECFNSDHPLFISYYNGVLGQLLPLNFITLQSMQTITTTVHVALFCPHILISLSTILVATKFSL